MGASTIAVLARHDRALLTASLIGITGLAWVYLLRGAGMDMTMTMPMTHWTPGYAVIVFVMWAVMMVAMMLPSAAPTILLVSALERQRVGHLTAGVAGGAAGLFATGYVLTWVGFSLAATVLLWCQQGRDDFADDGSDQPHHCRRCADCRGDLSVDAAEGCLPATLPFAPSDPGRALAPRLVRRAARRRGEWTGPHGLLLGPDGAAVCWRCHEFRLDRRPDAVGSD